jgi:hypothetical protein
VCIGTLNASWALALSDLALTTITVHTPRGFFGQDGGGGHGGGGGGGRGGRGGRHGGGGGHQGGGGNRNPPANPSVCRDFAPTVLELVL